MFGDHKIQQTFHIFETLHAKVILGLDFLRDNKVKTDFENMKLQFPISKHRNCYVYNEHLSHITVSTFQESSIEIAMAETISEAILEPHSETIIPVKIPKFRTDTTVILEPQQNLSQNLSVAGEKTVTCIDQGIGTNRLLNPANFPVYLHPRCRIAKAQPIDKYCIHTLEESNSTNLFSVSDNNVKSDDHYKKILLDLGINLDNTEITSEQKTRLCQLLGQNRDIFAKNLSELGKTEMHYHTIHTKENKTVSSAPYRQTPQMCAELDKQLNEMERHGTIEESTSPFHSPVVLVKKKNNEYRFCVDFRALSRITEQMSFPITHIFRYIWYANRCTGRNIFIDRFMVRILAGTTGPFY